MINDYAEVIPAGHVTQENCALPITGAIAKLSAFRKLIAMATKLSASDFHTSAYAFDLVPHDFCGNNYLLILVVGRGLLLPMTVSSYLGTLTLPGFNLIQVITSQVYLFFIQVVPSSLIHTVLLSLPLSCHQERPIDITTHCFPAISAMCCSSSCMVRKYLMTSQ